MVLDENSLIFLMIFSSVSLSKALVASSKNKISGSLYGSSDTYSLLLTSRQLNSVGANFCFRVIRQPSTKPLSSNVLKLFEILIHQILFDFKKVMFFY